MRYIHIYIPFELCYYQFWSYIISVSNLKVQGKYLIKFLGYRSYIFIWDNYSPIPIIWSSIGGEFYLR